MQGFLDRLRRFSITVDARRQHQRANSLLSRSRQAVLTAQVRQMASTIFQPLGLIWRDLECVCFAFGFLDSWMARDAAKAFDFHADPRSHVWPSDRPSVSIARRFDKVQG